MGETIEAIFEGKVIRPKDPLPLEPSTRVRVTIERVEPEEGGVRRCIRARPHPHFEILHVRLKASETPWWMSGH